VSPELGPELEALADALAGLGVESWPARHGSGLSVWVGLLVRCPAEVFLWTEDHAAKAHPADDPSGAARRIAARRRDLIAEAEEAAALSAEGS
jgi:hypothetical protein